VCCCWLYVLHECWRAGRDGECCIADTVGSVVYCRDGQDEVTTRLRLHLVLAERFVVWRRKDPLCCLLI
jgi:hypothetical protein